MVRIAVVDLETTGDQPEDVPVEAAFVFLEDGKPTFHWHSLVHPGDREIHPCAQANHHLSRKDLKRGIDPKPEFWIKMVEDCDYIAAHYADFDKQYLPDLQRPWICTHRCSLHLFPDAPKHGLQVLRYFLKLKPTIPPGLAPHRALYDAQVCASLIQRMLEEKSADELLALTTAPLILGTVKFGKHRGMQWSELPMDYLHWILRQDFDEDTKHTARHYIEETRKRRSESQVPLVQGEHGSGGHTAVS